MSETRRLTESATVRVSAEELAIIRDNAARAGLSIGGYFRAAALERRTPSPPPELLRGLAELGRMRSLLEAALRTPEHPGLPALVLEALAVVREIGSGLRAG